MNNLLEQIIGAVGRGWCSKENAHKEMDSTLALAIADEVLAELTKGQEPVGEIKHNPGGCYEGSPIPAAPYDYAEFYESMPPAGTPLYAAPTLAVCPTCTQRIDDAAKAGRIVDDRIPDGWQLVPKEPANATLKAMAHTYEDPNKWTWRETYKAMLAAAPEYRK